jgi:hypothetical protein
MTRDPINDLLVALENRFPRLKRIFPVVALVLLVLIIGFGLYALSSLSTSPLSVVNETPAPRGTPAAGQGGGVFEQIWSTTTPPIQDLALVRADKGGPPQVLALVRDKVSRFDPQGRLVNEIAVPAGTFRLTSDVHGRVGFFLTTSTESYWNWGSLRRVATAHHVTAIDLQGRTLWTYTLPAVRSSANDSVPLDVLVTDIDGARGSGIIVDLGGRIVYLDAAGSEIWSLPVESRQRFWSDVDWEGSGHFRALAVRPTRDRLEIVALSADRRLETVMSLEGQSSLDAWEAARMAQDAEPMVATLAMASTPDAQGKVPERFDVYSMIGAPVGRAKLPWPTRPISKPLATVDTDGDGLRAWLAAGDDGVLYLFSADARGQEAHHMGMYIRRVIVVPMSGSGDLLVLGTERGLRVWRRRVNFGSAVD